MATARKIVHTDTAPAAIGPYSQAVVVDRTMYISGQLGLDTASGQLVAGGVQAQAKQALINMGEILKAAGSSYDNVVKTTVLLADMNDFNNVNEVYKQSCVMGDSWRSAMKQKLYPPYVTYAASDLGLHRQVDYLCGCAVFSSNFPARAAYQVAALPRGGLVEIEAVAIVGPVTNAS